MVEFLGVVVHRYLVFFWQQSYGWGCGLCARSEHADTLARCENGALSIGLVISQLKTIQIIGSWSANSMSGYVHVHDV